MNQSEPEWADIKQEQPVETGSIPAAFNTFPKYSDHHPHQSRYLSKKEEEGTGESSHGDSFEADKQQQRHSISNNFSVNSKSETTPAILHNHRFQLVNGVRLFPLTNLFNITFSGNVKAFDFDPVWSSGLSQSFWVCSLTQPDSFYMWILP